MKKSVVFILQTLRCLLICITLVAFGAVDALAFETGGFTRADWDLIMRWVNFIILATLIIKYARKPLGDFLQNKKNEMAVLIDRYESQKEAAEVKIVESQRLLVESEKRLKVVEERIIAEGERRKAAAIESARNESRIMIETAQHKIEGQLREMHAKLKAEIVDSAFQKAIAKLPSVLSINDHEKLVHQWIEAVQR